MSENLTQCGPAQSARAALDCAKLYQDQLRELYGQPVHRADNAARRAEASQAIGQALKAAEVFALLDVAAAVRDLAARGPA